METKRFKVTLTFVQEVLGTLPQKEVATEYLLTKAPPEQSTTDEQATMPEMLEKGTTGFHRADGKVILYDYQLKGMFKEAAGVFNGLQGVKNLKSKVGNYLFVTPRRIPVQMPEGGEVGHLERPLRAMTMQGERVTVARSEMIPEGTTVTFTVVLLPGPITEAIVRGLLEYGEYKGFGQWRSGGYGRHSFTVEPIAD